MECNHIHASCMGTAPDHLYQDYVMVEESESHLIAAIADGLGSKVSSQRGSNLICQLIIDFFKKGDADPFAPGFTDGIIDEWYRFLSCKGVSCSDCQTTSSFLFFDKLSLRILMGSIGDSTIIYRQNKGEVIALSHSKEFLNETECIGGRTHPHYRLKEQILDEQFDCLIATDGFADEILEGKEDGLFEYLESKYTKIRVSERDTMLKRELVSTIKGLNPDDKTLFYCWINR